MVNFEVNFEPGIPLARTPQEIIREAYSTRRRALSLLRPVEGEELVLTEGEAEALAAWLETDLTIRGLPAMKAEELLDVLRRGEALIYGVRLRVDHPLSELAKNLSKIVS